MSALAKLTWVEVKLFAREPITVVFAFAFPLVVLTVLAGVFSSEGADPDFRGFEGVDYYLPSYVAVVIAAVGLIGLPVHLAAYRERGILRRFRASAVPAAAVLAAQALVCLLVITLGSVLLVVVAVLADDAKLPESWAGALLAFLVGTASFVALGFLLAAIVRSPRAAQGAGLVLFFPMWLLCGAGPPRPVMSDTMRTVGDALPLTHVVTALQDPWLGFGSATTVLIGLAAVFAAAAVLAGRLLRSA